MNSSKNISLSEKIHFSQESLLSRLTYSLIEHEFMLIWTNSESKTQALCCSLKRFCPMCKSEPVTRMSLGMKVTLLACQNAWLGHMFHYKPVFCFTGTWHTFSPHPFFPPFFWVRSIRAKKNMPIHSHSLLAQQIHYILKRPFPTYRWAWNRWVITWPVTSLPYCYLLTSDSFGKPRARSQHGLLSCWFEWRWRLLQVREGLQTQRSSEFVPPWVCLFIHQDLMHPSLGSFCFGTFRFHLKENDTF